MARRVLVRKLLARVLADKIRHGWYSREDALSIAGTILYDTPRTLLGMVPYR